MKKYNQWDAKMPKKAIKYLSTLKVRIYQTLFIIHADTESLLNVIQNWQNVHLTTEKKACM